MTRETNFLMPRSISPRKGQIKPEVIRQYSAFSCAIRHDFTKRVKALSLVLGIRPLRFFLFQKYFLFVNSKSIHDFKDKSKDMFTGPPLPRKGALPGLLAGTSSTREDGIESPGDGETAVRKKTAAVDRG